jgi:hypothetical protein
MSREDHGSRTRIRPNPGSNDSGSLGGSHVHQSHENLENSPRFTAAREIDKTNANGHAHLLPPPLYSATQPLVALGCTVRKRDTPKTRVLSTSKESMASRLSSRANVRFVLHSARKARCTNVHEPRHSKAGECGHDALVIISDPDPRWPPGLKWRVGPVCWAHVPSQP